MDYCIGHKVVHPSCGAGTITRIQEKSLGDTVCLYYVIDTAAKGRRLFVPVDKAEEIGIHPVGERSSIEEILDAPFEALDEETISQDHKDRQKDMRELLKSGDFEVVTDVVRHLCFLSVSRPLGTVDRSLYELGKELMAAEYALASNVDYKEGLRQIEDSLSIIVRPVAEEVLAEK